MEHNEIEQFDFVDRYLLGGLTPEESARFEEHFIDCSQCIDQLKTTESFLKGLRLVTSRRTSPSGSLLWRILPSTRLTLAGICLTLIVCLGAVVAINRIRRLRMEVDQVNVAAAQEIGQLEEKRKSAEKSERDGQAREAELNGRLQDLEARLKAEQEKKNGEIDESPRAGAMTNLSIFTLNSVGRGNPDSNPTEIRLPRPTPKSFMISFALEGENHHRDYCVTAFDHRGKRKPPSCGLSPNGDTISVFCHSQFFPTGDYSFVVDAVTKEGRRKVVANYQCRIERTIQPARSK